MAKQINVTDAVYDEIQRRKSTVGTIAQQKRPDTPGGCSMENQFDGNGDMTGTACIGGCGGLDRFLGRSCVKVQRDLPNGGFGFSCQCIGGWWDNLLGR